MQEAYKPLSRHIHPSGKFACSAVHFETVHNLLFIQPTWGSAGAGLSGVGRVFGCAVTELYVERFGHGSHGTQNAVQLRRMAHTCNFLEMLGTLLRDSFSALRSFTVVSGLSIIKPDEKNRELPWLHVIAVGRPIPGKLQSIVLQTRHDQENNRCCKQIIGTSEKVVGSEQRLPELLFGLAELTIRFEKCDDPEKCARYIWSVLPGMRDALWFQYRARDVDAWKPYTLPAVK